MVGIGVLPCVILLGCHAHLIGQLQRIGRRIFPIGGVFAVGKGKDRHFISGNVPLQKLPPLTIGGKSDGEVIACKRIGIAIGNAADGGGFGGVQDNVADRHSITHRIGKYQVRGSAFGGKNGEGDGFGFVFDPLCQIIERLLQFVTRIHQIGIYRVGIVGGVIGIGCIVSAGIGCDIIADRGTCGGGICRKVGRL